MTYINISYFNFSFYHSMSIKSSGRIGFVSARPRWWCSQALYNMVWNGCLSIQPTELPEELKCRTKTNRVRENKKRYGTSISSRPKIVSLHLEEVSGEGNTMVGKRAGDASVVFSLLEKKAQMRL